MRFHCGISEFCRRTSPKTVEAAMRNIKEHFVVVAIVEDMMLSFRVLEVTLPRLFGGLVKRYKDLGEMRLRQNTKTGYSEKHRDFVVAQPLMQLEYRLYDFARERLADQAASCFGTNLRARGSASSNWDTPSR